MKKLIVSAAVLAVLLAVGCTKKAVEPAAPVVSDTTSVVDTGAVAPVDTTTAAPDSTVAAPDSTKK